MKILICGGRDCDPLQVRDYLNNNIKKIFSDLSLGYYDITIIQGGARGADHGAKLFADQHTYHMMEFPADWKKHGKAAGPIRNRQMIVEGNPDLIIAFPGGSGTMNMVKQGRDNNILVYEIPKKE